jgi:hypothetical protein
MITIEEAKRMLSQLSFCSSTYWLCGDMIAILLDVFLGFGL